MTSIAFSDSYIDPAGSPIRELFPYLSRPGMISFAGGYPSPSLFDVEGLQEAGQSALANPVDSLQYGATEGMPILRSALAQLCQTRGIACDDADVLITTGSQQAFDLLVRILVESGTSVYVESPAYPAAIQALRLAQACIHEIPVDADGLSIDVLRHRLETAAPEDRPKLPYTVPNFSNPSGTLMNASRRQVLVKLAVQYGFLIIEDDPYGELSFGEKVPAPIYAEGLALAGTDNPVLYLSSLSKTVAPALRVGWMLASPEIVRRCAVAKQVADLCTSPLAQAIAAHYLTSGRYEPAVARARAEYGSRMQALVQSLRSEVGDRLTFTEPRGGMFLWATCSSSLDASRLFQVAVDKGVVYVPGSAFYQNNGGEAAMRLSYAASTVDEIIEGVKRLAMGMY